MCFLEQTKRYYKGDPRLSYLVECIIKWTIELNNLYDVSVARIYNFAL